MSDNIAVTPGSGATVAADDVSSVLYQRVKLDIGADGASTPVTDLATSAKQDTGNTSLSSLDTKTPSLGQALAASSTPVVLTAAQITTLTPPAAITGFALAATQTDKTQFTKLTDGTDTALVTAAGEQNVLETNSASIKTSVELIDNAVSGAGFNITQQGGVAVSLNTGVRDAGTQRVTIATNDAVPVTFTGSTDVATQTTLASLLTSSQLIDDIIFTAGTSTYTEATSKGGLYLAVRRDADTTLADTTNEMVPLQVNATGQLKTAIIAALPAGSAVIGHVITDSGSTTAVTGTVTISGAVTEATLDAALISQEATTSGVKGITAFGAVTTAKPTYTTAKSDALSLDVNGLLRVSLADTPVNGTSLSVNATLTAETTKVIGVTRTADGAGNLLTTNSTTYTAKFGLDGNLLGTLGTAFSTAGKVDVKAADGDVFVRQTTAANLNMTEASAASILTSVQLIDDIVYTDDTSTHATGTSKGALIMGAATPTDTAVNANDIGAIGMTNNREMYVSLRDNNGTATASGSGTAAAALRVELANNGTGTLATVSTVTTVTTLTGTTTLTPGTAAANLGKAEDVAHSTGDTGVAAWGVANEAQTVTAADGDYMIQATDTKGNRLVVGNLAHDAVDAGFPLKVGGQAITALPAAVANADRTNFVGDKFGRQVAIVGTVRDLVGTQTTTISASTSETTIATAVASTFLDLTVIMCSNTSATATRVDFRDTTAGSVLFSIYVPAGDVRGVSFSRPIPQTTVNTNWTAQSSASITDLRIYVAFDKNK